MMRLTKVESCFVGALIDGLRLIDDKVRDSGIEPNTESFNALVDYVQAKGQQIAAANGIRIPKQIRNLTPDQRERHRKYAREHYRKNRGRYAMLNQRWRTRFARHVKERQHLYYRNNLPRFRAYRKRQYWSDPEKWKAAARNYYHEHRPEIRQYNLKRRGHRTELEKARYHRIKNTPKFKAQREATLLRALPKRRAYRQRMVASLPEGYIRSKLAYQYKRPPDSFTHEEVEEKRASILRHRAPKLQNAA